MCHHVDKAFNLTKKIIFRGTPFEVLKWLLHGVGLRVLSSLNFWINIVQIILMQTVQHIIIHFFQISFFGFYYILPETIGLVSLTSEKNVVN